MKHYTGPITLLSVIICLSIVTGCKAQVIPTVSAETGRPDNIILFIGDGMGVAHVYAGLTANHGVLNMTGFTSIGFSKTNSVSNYVTDSGAGATAMATGNKTYNGAIGVTKDSFECKSILEYAEKKGLSTGLVSTSAITHATPASFIAHNKSRDDYEGIALDFLKTDIDVFIGGGRDHFTVRKDNKNLLDELRKNDYQVIFSLDSIRRVNHGKLAGLTAPQHCPSIIDGRGDMLPVATVTALNILSQNNKGFFLMVEGSQIDWGAHSNNIDFVTKEVIDFDEAIGKALAFAKENGRTLIIVTADHETGGLAIVDGDFKEGTVVAQFATTNHTGIMVPVFAFGPGAQLFQGVQDNTDIFYNIMRLFDIKPEPVKKTH
jgi:alkaline phosphatase